MKPTAARSEQVFRLRSFVKDGRGGNLAAVVRVKPDLPAARMQAMACEIGYSETVFVMPSEKADFCLRFFTPLEEVSLCGHATIAAFELLRLRGEITSGLFTQETKEGILDVEVKEDGSVFMVQSQPKFLSMVPWDKLLECFGGLEKAEMRQTLQPQIVSTGLADILMPVPSLPTLLGMSPDFARISALSKNLNVTGIHAFALESLTGATAHCRNIAPSCGIDEESATGTSNGALSSYLFHHGVIGPLEASMLRFDQGYCMGSPSEILARLETSGGGIDRVWVGGRAIFS